MAVMKDIASMIVGEGKWNTGALYTTHGQRIGAVRLEDNSIHFADVDRGIEGVIPADFQPHASVRERVMRGYMHGECEYWRNPLSSTDWELAHALRKHATNLALDAPLRDPTARYTGF